LFIYLFVIDLGVLALTLLETKLIIVDALAGLAAFILLATWTTYHLTTKNLYTALAFYFIFALFHSAAPLVLQRLRKISHPVVEPRLSGLRAPATVDADFPAHRAFDSHLAVRVDCRSSRNCSRLWNSHAASDSRCALLTLIAMGAWLMRIPSELTGLPTSLFILAAFAIFFMVAASWASRRSITVGTRAPKLFGDITDPGNLSVQLPALSPRCRFCC